jgi:polysaccharide pyruvyl transferase WcaK-like protein
MKPITIEVHGTGTHNRGAELMAYAAHSALKTRIPDIRTVVSSADWAYEARMNYGFYTNLEFKGRLRAKTSSVFARAMSPSARSSLGISLPEEVDAVLDASGFALSDQRGVGPARGLLRRLSKHGSKKQMLILLPQAMGPFENADVAQLARQVINRASIVYARDQQSLEAVRRLGCKSDIIQAPDFTIAVPAIEGSHLPPKHVAIVPNFRIGKHVASPQVYEAFLERVISSITQRNFTPVFVLHSPEEDVSITEAARRRHGIAVLSDPDPRRLKGILGSAHFVVGSRYHALVGALSQGVPSIGIGWSHKYGELFRDFGVPDLVTENIADFGAIDQIVARLCDDRIHADYRRLIRSHKLLLVAQAESMWDCVAQSIIAQQGK